MIDRHKPQEVDVLTVRYAVDYDHTKLPLTVLTASQKAKGVVPEASVSGICDHDHQSIVIDERLGPDYQAETLLHEVLHTLFYIIDINISSEEHIVRSLAPVLLYTLRSNPQLLEFIL